MEPYDIPAYLDKRPSFVFGLTARQVCTFAIGTTLGMIVSNDLNNGFIGICLFFVVMLATLAFMFMRPQGMDLDRWLLFWLAYTGMPRVFLWHPLKTDTSEPQETTHEERADDLW